MGAARLPVTALEGAGPRLHSETEPCLVGPGQRARQARLKDRVNHNSRTQGRLGRKQALSVHTQVLRTKLLAGWGRGVRCSHALCLPSPHTGSLEDHTPAASPKGGHPGPQLMPALALCVSGPILGTRTPHLPRTSRGLGKGSTSSQTRMRPPRACNPPLPLLCATPCPTLPSPSQVSGRRAGRQRHLSAAASGPEPPSWQDSGKRTPVEWEGGKERCELAEERQTHTDSSIQVGKQAPSTGAPEDHSPGEKISGLKRTSKAVLLMEPTALHALRITSRLRGLL